MHTLMVSIIIIHNMSSATLKKNSGLQVGSYIETTTPMAIYARMDLKNSLRPEIKIQHQPMSANWITQLINSGSTENCSHVVHIILRECKLRT